VAAIENKDKRVNSRVNTISFFRAPKQVMLPVKRLQCNDPAEHVPDGWWFMFISLLLHPVVEVLVPGGGELVLDDITHAHKILQPLLEDRVHAHVVWASSVSVSFRRTKTAQKHTVSLNTQVHLRLGRMGNRVTAELDIRAIQR
jgi:hypothetical protein